MVCRTGRILRTLNKQTNKLKKNHQQNSHKFSFDPACYFCDSEGRNIDFWRGSAALFGLVGSGEEA